MSRAPPSNCLFLPELPVDLTDATLERHFRGFVGFQVARTRHDRNGKLVGFVEFDAVDDAVRCRESMQGASPFEGISWHIHYSNNTKGTPKRPREEMEQPVGRMEAQRPMYDRPNNQQMMPPPPGAPMMQSPGGGYGGPHHGGPHGPHHGPHGGPPGPMYQPMGPGPGPMGPVPAGSSMPVTPPPAPRPPPLRHAPTASPHASQPLLLSAPPRAVRSPTTCHSCLATPRARCTWRGCHPTPPSAKSRTSSVASKAMYPPHRSTQCLLPSLLLLDPSRWLSPVDSRWLSPLAPCCLSGTDPCLRHPPRAQNVTPPPSPRPRPPLAPRAALWHRFKHREARHCHPRIAPLAPCR